MNRTNSAPESLTEDEIWLCDRLFLNRQPSETELTRMKAARAGHADGCGQQRHAEDTKTTAKCGMP
jgi:hypothetical protein